MIKADDNLWEAKIHTNKYFNHKKLRRSKKSHIIYYYQKFLISLISKKEG